ncbi:MAG: hypothetical protein ABSG43_10695 [Solirubrobacteraceae bacterium]|jgi:hypothetical protein
MAATLPRRRFLLTLALATLGTLLGLMIKPTKQVPLPLTIVAGTTGQKTTFYLALRGTRAVAVKTSLGARCGDGSTWAAKWSPAEGRPVHFVTTGNSFSTQESIKLTYARGVYGTARFQLQGWLTGPSTSTRTKAADTTTTAAADAGDTVAIGTQAAEGTIQLQASFNLDGSWAYCDSQPVAWAVGPNAKSRLATVPLGT